MLAGDSGEMGGPIPAGFADDRSLVTTPSFSATDPATPGAEDRGAAIRAPLGVRIALDITCAFRGRRSVECWIVTACRCFTTSIKSPDYRSENRGRSDTSEPPQASWCTSISGSRAASLTSVAIGSWGASKATGTTTGMAGADAATRSCTMPSMTTPGWLTPKSSMMNAKRPPPNSGCANAFFAAAGITVTAVMTDNGSCYRSLDFAAALGPIKHVWTRPNGPQINEKVERFNRTLATEWAYAASYSTDEARAAEYPRWLHHYNHHRPHTGIGGQTPPQRVHNITGDCN